MEKNDGTAIAERVRRACIDAAIAAYEDAGIQGLCGEGRWEYAIAAIRQLDFTGFADLSVSTKADDIEGADE
jgi:hypothetical protein